MLEKSSIMKLINNLTQTSMLATSPAEVYVRLIISCFDYTKEFNDSRRLLEKFLFHHPEESVRIYTTNFLRVLLRANVPDFSLWAMEALVRQLDSQFRVVHYAAADILDEACDLDDNLEGLIKLKQVVDTSDQTKNVLDILRNTGDAGYLLICRYASSPNGLRYLIETPRSTLTCPLDSVLRPGTPGTGDNDNTENIAANLLKQSIAVRRASIMKIESEFDVELKRWQQIFNYRYVKLVEDVLNNSMTYHQKGEDGKYGRRIDRINPINKNSYLPPHLYGQLALHSGGVEILLTRKLMDPVYETLRNPAKDLDQSELSLLKYKSALWIVGNVGSSESGFQALDNSKGLIKLIVEVARTAKVLSLRGTAFYVLGLLGSTEEGAEELKEHGWIVQANSMIALPLDLDLILKKPQDDSYSNVYESSSQSTNSATCNHGDHDNNGDKKQPQDASPIHSSPSLSGFSGSLHPALREKYSAHQLDRIRRDILKYVIHLSGPLATKQAEERLLDMKRKFSLVFKYDLDLYIEVCNQLAKYNFRLNCRRFLQELFLDITITAQDTNTTTIGSVVGTNNLPQIPNHNTSSSSGGSSSNNNLTAPMPPL